MNNEIILIITLIVTYGIVVFTFAFGKKEALYVYSAIATVAANIEVLICVNAFGMEMTLGNILFASTFLVTDALSETQGKKAAQKAVNYGVFATVLFLVISQSWFLYTPNSSDWAMPSIRAVFSNTPRVMIVSLLVYLITQRFDVWAYHKWWKFTTDKFGDSKKYLWLRNNGSTLISQLLNNIMFTLGSFAGVYSAKTLIHIIISSYVIFIATSLADTPAIYLIRRIHDRKMRNDNGNQ